MNHGILSEIFMSDFPPLIFGIYRIQDILVNNIILRNV